MHRIKIQFLHLPYKRFFFYWFSKKLPMYKTLKIIQNFICPDTQIHYPQVQILEVGTDIKR